MVSVEGVVLVVASPVGDEEVEIAVEVGIGPGDAGRGVRGVDEVPFGDGDKASGAIVEIEEVAQIDL